jgi:tetratricopeptide (TPR) repeat protein
VLPFKEWWFDSGLCRLFLSECSRNIHFLEERLKSSPNDHLLIADLAVALAFFDNRIEARLLFEEATDLSPNDAVYWHQRGLNHRDLREIDEALRCFERALQVKPDYDRAKRSLHQLKEFYLKS